jgi:hypothetical protein
MKEWKKMHAYQNSEPEAQARRRLAPRLSLFSSVS